MKITPKTEKEISTSEGCSFCSTHRIYDTFEKEGVYKRRLENKHSEFCSDCEEWAGFKINKSIEERVKEYEDKFINVPPDRPCSAQMGLEITIWLTQAFEETEAQIREEIVEKIKGLLKPWEDVKGSGIVKDLTEFEQLHRSKVIREVLQSLKP